jgi:hypothetical protein
MRRRLAHFVGLALILPIAFRSTIAFNVKDTNAVQENLDAVCRPDHRRTM